MNLITTLRNRKNRLARAGGGVFVVLWLSLVLAPCAAAMSAMDSGGMSGPDCPHCPPEPCHEVQDEECSFPDSLDVPRPGESGQFELVALPPAVPEVKTLAPLSEIPYFVATPPIRYGPRLHLKNVQFDE